MGSSCTTINLDDDAFEAVMARYLLTSNRDAVNFALRALAAEPMSLDQARSMRGSGWDGDLDQLPDTRTAGF